MVNPVPGYKVTTPFGKPGSWAAGYHTGEDYAAPIGALVVAAESGVVVYSGDSGGWGNAYGKQIIIDSNGIRHLYGHLSSRLVSRGDVVTAGDKIAYVGNTGRSTGPHLHYEERKNSFRYGVDARKPKFPTDPSTFNDIRYGSYHYGENRPAHRALQRRLFEKGFDPGFGDWPTEYYGDGTRGALAKFQESLGWTGADANGIPGPKTLEELGLPEKLIFRRDGLVYLTKMEEGTADSDSVWNLQVKLLLLGYSIPNGPTDYFGSQTKNAVKEFQKKLGWAPEDISGIPNALLLKKLGLNFVDDLDQPVYPKPQPKPVDKKPEAPEWMPSGAIWDPLQWADGRWVTGLRAFSVFDSPAPKVTLHTTEGSSKPNWSQINSGFPHATVSYEEKTVWWHIPIDMAAFTLAGGERSPNSAGGVNIQLEIVGFAKDSPNWSQEKCDWLREVIEEICEKIECPYVYPLPVTGSDGYGSSGTVRQTWPKMVDTTGVVLHSHWPFNNHWDAGKVPIDRLTGFPVVIEVPPIVGADPRWDTLATALRMTADLLGENTDE